MRDWALQHCRMSRWINEKSGFGSHVPTLLQLLIHTTGPILELGVGEYSTPLIHAFTWNRRAYSLDDNPDIFDVFSERFASPTHRFQFVPNYDFDDVIKDTWYSVILIDHAEDKRERDLKRFALNGKFILVHDCPGRSDFKYSFSIPGSATVVVSNFREIDFIEDL